MGGYWGSPHRRALAAGRLRHTHREIRARREEEGPAPTIVRVCHAGKGRGEGVVALVSRRGEDRRDLCLIPTALASENGTLPSGQGYRQAVEEEVPDSSRRTARELEDAQTGVQTPECTRRRLSSRSGGKLYRNRFFGFFLPNTNPSRLEALDGCGYAGGEGPLRGPPHGVASISLGSTTFGKRRRQRTAKKGSTGCHVLGRFDLLGSGRRASCTSERRGDSLTRGEDRASRGVGKGLPYTQPASGVPWNCNRLTDGDFCPIRGEAREDYTKLRRATAARQGVPKAAGRYSREGGINVARSASRSHNGSTSMALCRMSTQLDKQASPSTQGHVCATSSAKTFSAATTGTAMDTAQRSPGLRGRIPIRIWRSATPIRDRTGHCRALGTRRTRSIYDGARDARGSANSRTRTSTMAKAMWKGMDSANRCDSRYLVCAKRNRNIPSSEMGGRSSVRGSGSGRGDAVGTRVGSIKGTVGRRTISYNRRARVDAAEKCLRPPLQAMGHMAGDRSVCDGRQRKGREVFFSLVPDGIVRNRCNAIRMGEDNILRMSPNATGSGSGAQDLRGGRRTARISCRPSRARASAGNFEETSDNLGGHWMGFRDNGDPTRSLHTSRPVDRILLQRTAGGRWSAQKRSRQCGNFFFLVGPLFRLFPVFPFRVSGFGLLYTVLVWTRF